MVVDTSRSVADNVAGILVNANRTAQYAHDVLRISLYLVWISEAHLHPAAEPMVVKLTAQTLLVDGNQGL